MIASKSVIGFSRSQTTQRGKRPARSEAAILADVCQRSTTALREKLMRIAGLRAADVVDTIGNGITALDSCATALYCALRFREVAFVAMLRFIIECGGDVDTIAAMAGAMWGAGCGAEHAGGRGLGVCPQWR